MTRTGVLPIALLAAAVAGLLGGVLPAAGVPADAPEPSGDQCSADDLLEQIRRGLRSESPARRRYLRRLLREAAPTVDEARLLAAFAGESDPAVIEELGAALVARTDRLGDPRALRAVAARASTDPDPLARAAATRALRGSSALEHAPEAYLALVGDGSAEVRREAADNLASDNESVFGGVHRGAAEVAVNAALAAGDPEVTARVLGGLSTASIGTDAVGRIRRLLDSDLPELRAAAATALGGSPAAEMVGAREALLELYRAEPAVEVRAAVLASIARLGFAAAVPDLRALRAVDPRLAVDVDEWIAALGLGLQEWSLILREKQRLEQARPTPTGGSK